MVDAIVSFAVERLGDFLIQEADSLLGVRDGVEWLKRELGMMQCFLEVAEERRDVNPKICEWISDVRDAAFHIEDAIDIFTYSVAVGENLKRKRGLLASVGRIARMFSKKTHLYILGKEIEALRKWVDDISRRSQVYGIRNIGEAREGTGGEIGKLRKLRRSCPYADEEHVVGFEDDIASLVGELFNREQRRRVISIFGMGGLGKTALARKLYHHPKVELVFGYHRAWVCVSQEYGIRDLLQRLIKSFKCNINREELEMLEKMSEEDLEGYLRQYLQGVPYLVVIDDVWDKEAWESLRKAFPDDNNGSRVIVTTRIEAVAERSDERTYVHKLRFLRSDESWELFCKKAFPNNTATSSSASCCPCDLEALGREMVEKCRGLPLAITALGGLLSRKQPHEWQMGEHIWLYLRNDSIHIRHLLTLSFIGLPFLLKRCFLYLGLFPKDSVIRAARLIHLWVAEGFIPPSNDQTMEEVAEDSLKELIGRSLIQAAKRNWRRTTACRVHDLLQELVVKWAMEINFLHIYNGGIHSAPRFGTVPSFRREAVHFDIERYVLYEYPNPRLRSLMYFESEEGLGIESLTRIHTRFRLLGVLDLENIRIGNYGGTIALPNEVGELIQLKYLGLRHTDIEELPPSIVGLQALQTLDAFSPNARVRLPGNIGNLTQLRHLFGFFPRLGGVDHLTNLQSLKGVDIREWFNIDTVNLINLRDLAITALALEGEIKTEFSWEPVANLRNLQSLSVKLLSLMYFSSFRPLSNCRGLHQLMLNGKIQSLPEQIHEYLPNLKFLLLKNSELMHDPLPTLEKLPNLMILQLWTGNWWKLTCNAEGFARLEVLMLFDLHCLKEFEVAEGAMPILKGLQVQRCRNFSVPERFRSIPDAVNLMGDWIDEHFVFFPPTGLHR